jgi:hypothetical protein
LPLALDPLPLALDGQGLTFCPLPFPAVNDRVGHPIPADWEWEWDWDWRGARVGEGLGLQSTIWMRICAIVPTALSLCDVASQHDPDEMLFLTSSYFSLPPLPFSSSNPEFEIQSDPRLETRTPAPISIPNWSSVDKRRAEIGDRPGCRVGVGCRLQAASCKRQAVGCRRQATAH